MSFRIATPSPLLFQLAVLALLLAVARGATNVVTTLADNGPGSLRQILLAAAPGDSITFATNGVLTLTSGELTIRTNLNIVGPGRSNLVISGNGASRVLYVSAYTTGMISGITIRDGWNTALNFGIQVHFTISACMFSSNRTQNGDNGMPGTSYTGCSVRHDGGDGQPGHSGGGGAAAVTSGIVYMLDCSFIGNRTGNGGDGGPGGNGAGPYANGGAGGRGGPGGNGGAIYNFGTLILSNCTFNGNSTGVSGKGGLGGYPGTGCRTDCTPMNNFCVGQRGADGGGGGAGLGKDVYTAGVTLRDVARVSSFRRVTTNTFELQIPEIIDGTFNVLASTNVAQSITQWTNLGRLTLVSNNLYRFSDYAITPNTQQRFYRLGSP